MAGERHGKGMGAAGARHAMCESGLRGSLSCEIGVVLSPKFDTAASNGITVPSVETAVYGAGCSDSWQRKSNVLGPKPSPQLLCSPQIPYKMKWN
jgi:hypothetical protein